MLQNKARPMLLHFAYFELKKCFVIEHCIFCFPKRGEAPAKPLLRVGAAGLVRREF